MHSLTKTQRYLQIVVFSVDGCFNHRRSNAFYSAAVRHSQPGNPSQHHPVVQQGTGSPADTEIRIRATVAQRHTAASNSQNLLPFGPGVEVHRGVLPLPFHLVRPVVSLFLDSFRVWKNSQSESVTDSIQNFYTNLHTWLLSLSDDLISIFSDNDDSFVCCFLLIC